MRPRGRFLLHKIPSNARLNISIHAALSNFVERRNRDDRYRSTITDHS